jgi:ATP-binding cassette, subfamily B, bacterial MsbA
LKTFFRILAYAKPYYTFLPQYIFLTLIAVTFSAINLALLIPLLDVLFNQITPQSVLPAFPDFQLSIDYFKALFNYLMIKYAKVDKRHALYFICFIVAGSVLVANIFRYLASRYISALRTKLVYLIRKDIFSQLNNLPLSFHNANKKGNLLSVMSADVSEVENSVISALTVFFREPFIIIVYFILLFILSFKLTLFTIFFFPLSGFVISRVSKILKRKADVGQALIGNLTSTTDELIGGSRIIKAFNAQAYFSQKFETDNSAFRKVVRSMLNIREMASPVSEFLGVGVVLVIIVYGGNLVLNNTDGFSASMFIGYLALYSQILAPAKNISNAISTIQRGLAAGERIFELLDTQNDIQDKTNAQLEINFEKEIQYSNVSFSYTRGDNGYVLKDINLTIQKGKTIALVGQSGSGKSTMADMLPRFYDVSGGHIKIDGVDLRDIKLNGLRNKMGIVSQEAILFNDSIYNNIVFGMENVTEEQVIHASKIANAHEFIERMDQGYQSQIGDRGARLSGGQRQRLSIARAVLRNPQILILDEATSALDTESERLVQEALNNLMKNRTSIVIAHRLSTIVNADEIVVMDRGTISERGTHTELLAKNGIYAKLYAMQQV